MFKGDLLQNVILSFLRLQHILLSAINLCPQNMKMCLFIISIEDARKFQMVCVNTMNLFHVYNY